MECFGRDLPLLLCIVLELGGLAESPCIQFARSSLCLDCAREHGQRRCRLVGMRRELLYAKRLKIFARCSQSSLMGSGRLN